MSAEIKYPLILCALEGRTSPFPQREELLQAVIQRFPDCQVVDLSKITASRPYDLLGLYDRAKLLITVDTMHLHLSRASNVPVIALVRDYPTYWNGTPWHKRLLMHCRYGVYQARKEELLQLAEDAVRGIPRVQTRPIVGLKTDSYNPSIIRYEGKLLMGYRFHPEKTPRTQLSMAELDDDFKVLADYPVDFPADIAYHSLEDCKLFLHLGRLFMSYTVSKYPRSLNCVVGYSELEFRDGRWRIKAHQQIKYGQNDWSGLEKNFVFFSHDSKLYCIYQVSPEHIVLEINGENVVEEYRTPCAGWNYGKMKGDSGVLPFNGEWIRFFHSRIHYHDDHKNFRYYVGALTMQSTPPFAVTKISRSPVMAGHEWRNAACFHHKQNVCFCGGAIADGDGFILSLGINDSCACVSKISKSHLRL